MAVLVMMVVLAVFAIIFIVSERRKAVADIVRNGETFANFSANTIYDEYSRFYTHPQASDFEHFKGQVQSILDYNKDVQSVELLSVNGRILFQSSELKDGKYKGALRSTEDNVLTEALQSEYTTTRVVDENGSQLTEIVVPIKETGGRHLLSMRYLLAYTSLAERMAEVYRTIIIVSCLLMLFVVAVATLLAMRLTRPIVRLTHTAERISAGDLTARAPEAGNEEVVRLARTLNEMAARLGEYYRNLEAKVRERTAALEAAQTKLMTNVKQDEALLSSIGDGVIATDQQGNIAVMNKAAEDMLRLPAAEALGRPYYEVWTAETENGEAVKTEDRPMYRALHGDRAIKTSQYYCVRRDAQGKEIVKIPILQNISPVVINGKTVGVISVFSDITHDKEVDRMKTEFISLASHQLRTPLSAIRWYSEMLLSGDAGSVTEEQKEFMQNVYDSTQRMIDLVNSLLNISRIESGRIIIDPKPTDLNELVGGVVNDLKAKIEEKQQTLIVSVHKELPKINLDAGLIGQVYMNFMTNAIKYTPKGGEISVFVSRKGEELVSQITDNGYGIPKEQQGRLFQKFFRAANAVKVETDGTGLGLYLVKAIIESSGGRVWFQSEENKGTTFWFSLPMSGMKAKAGEVTLERPTVK
jgi:PAS domain S-box-containing protein